MTHMISPLPGHSLITDIKVCLSGREPFPITHYYGSPEAIEREVDQYARAILKPAYSEGNDGLLLPLMGFIRVPEDAKDEDGICCLDDEQIEEYPWERNVSPQCSLIITRKNKAIYYEFKAAGDLLRRLMLDDEILVDSAGKYNKEMRELEGRIESLQVQQKPISYDNDKESLMLQAEIRLAEAGRRATHNAQSQVLFDLFQWGGATIGNPDLAMRIFALSAFLISDPKDFPHYPDTTLWRKKGVFRDVRVSRDFAPVRALATLDLAC